ncbi:MAG: hypothetical protein WA745_05815, partial [Methylovirgula sp.]
MSRARDADDHPIRKKARRQTDRRLVDALLVHGGTLDCRAPLRRQLRSLHAFHPHAEERAMRASRSMGPASRYSFFSACSRSISKTRLACTSAASIVIKS